MTQNSSGVLTMRGRMYPLPRMYKRLAIATVVGGIFITTAMTKYFLAQRGRLGEIIEQHRPDFAPIEAIYRDIHRHPELSGLESRTANIIASYLRSINFTVHEGIGGYGVVAVLANGPGPTIASRAELDALPIREMTDLPYASSVEMIDRKGTLRPVMHACGHDMNMASLLGAATLMKNAVSAWNGTFIALFQPDEEYTGGAQAMVDDGLYDLITKPDALLAQHVVPERDGFVAIREGVALAAADSIDIRVFGAPGPGVNPQNAIDSITASYKILARLQNLVAEGFPQEDFVKVWCRSFHAGDKDDDYVELTDMNVDIKTLDPKARENVLAIVKRVVEEESRAARSPKLPIINHRVRAPLTTNDIFIAKRIRNTFDKYFSTNSHEMEIDHASEDFANLAPGIPYAYWNFGGIDAAKWDHAKRENMTEVLIADNHSPFFAPTIQPTLRVGTEAMALAVLDLLINDLEAPSKHDLRL